MDADNLAQNLLLMLDKLADDSLRPEVSQCDLSSFWLRIGAGVQAVSKAATNLSLAYSEPVPPSSATLIAAMEHTALNLMSAYYSLPPNQGGALCSAVRDYVRSLVQALHNLVVALQAHVSDSASKQHLHSTGSVWEICDKFPQLPKDNKEAVVLRMVQSSQLIDDALSELLEALNNSDKEEDENGDEDDVVLTHEVMASCTGLVKTAKACMNRVLSAIQCAGRCDAVECSLQLDGVLVSAEQISPAIDDLAVVFYTSCQHHAVRTQCAELTTHLRQLLSKSKESHFFVASDMKWFEFLNKAIDHNVDKVQAVVGHF